MSQDEVDALLRGINEGEVETELDQGVPYTRAALLGVLESGIEPVGVDEAFSNEEITEAKFCDVSRHRWGPRRAELLWKRLCHLRPNVDSGPVGGQEKKPSAARADERSESFDRGRPDSPY